MGVKLFSFRAVMTKAVVWSVLIQGVGDVCRGCGVLLGTEHVCVEKFGPIRKFDGSV